MQTSDSYEKGFSSLALTLSIAAIVIISATLSIVRDQKHKNTQSAAVTQNSQTAQNLTPKNFVEVSNWQVRFAVDKPSEQFKVGAITTRNGNQIVTITNSAQQKVYQACGVSIIERSAAKTFYDPVNMRMKAEGANSTAKKVGNYWYKLQPELNSCFHQAISGAVVNDESAEDQYQAKLDAAGSLTDASLSNLVSVP